MTPSRRGCQTARGRRFPCDGHRQDGQVEGGWGEVANSLGRASHDNPHRSSDGSRTLTRRPY